MLPIDSNAVSCHFIFLEAYRTFFLFLACVCVCLCVTVLPSFLAKCTPKTRLVQSNQTTKKSKTLSEIQYRITGIFPFFISSTDARHTRIQYIRAIVEEHIPFIDSSPPPIHHYCSLCDTF